MVMNMDMGIVMKTENPYVELARFISENAEKALPLEGLARRVGASPAHVQKTFKAQFGLSPKAYQDMARQKKLKAALKEADGQRGGVAGAIFEAGFGSTSRVYGQPGRQMGMSLGSYRKGGQGEDIHYAVRATALGALLMAATPKGVCAVLLADDAAQAMDELRKEFPRATLRASESGRALDDWMALVELFIDHAGPRPDLPLDLRGTVFQQKVWRLLTTLGDNERLTYSELAARIGAPKAVRAAASACAANRIALLVPCHKVLRADGGLGGYRWGEARKARLLEAETVVA
jgi:AraC family transcriptional regulator, regulatory protein of adaptative response / methylated-DNA-[protein]-cysteine methyltransferase